MVSKKASIITGMVFAFVVVAAAASVAAFFIYRSQAHVSSSNDPIMGKIADTPQKAVQSLCQNTYYQETCVNTLSKSSNTTDQMTLIKDGFKVAIKDLAYAIEQSSPLEKASKDPNTAEAYKTCHKLLDDSMDDLQRTYDRLDLFNMTNIKQFVDDVRTWLTGALTFQDTCLDLFEDLKGETSMKMEELLKESRELTINGLALINEFSKFSNMPNEMNQGRRLLVHSQQPIDHDFIVDYIKDWKENVTTLDIAPGSRKLLRATAKTIRPNVIVAKDGSGNYKTINEALKNIPQKYTGTYIIHIKEGVYQEYVTIQKTMRNVMFIGDGPTKTKITGNKSYGGGIGTYSTATVAIEGDNFIAKDIGFENSAGAIMHQAVALRVTADYSIFYNCQMDGYQDTLYVHNHRQFYRDCTITGTIDFIFGNAEAVFQNCTMLIRKPLENQKLCMVTAQGRTLINETSAIVLQRCRIKPAPEYPINDKTYKAFLGRPWKPFSKTIVMDSELDGVIDPKGWSPWNNTNAHLNTCFYAEVNNRGPGAALRRRVKWPGIKRISRKAAAQYTPKEYLDGDFWIAGKGIPYV